MTPSSPYSWDVPLAAELYAAGEGIARLAAKFSTTYSRMRRSLLKHGVVFRDPVCPSPFFKPSGSTDHKQVVSSIDDMRIMASAFGGECLSEKYLGSFRPLRWRCVIGHEFSSSPVYVRQRRTNWCPVCLAAKKPTIEVLAAWAAERGGVCLSAEYATAKAVYQWRCADGHEFGCRWDNVRSGQWCPEHTYKGEHLCRRIFETVSGKTFKPVALPITSARGKRLRLDGFCPEMKLAFEHQGRFHYETGGLVSAQQLKKTRKHDHMKRAWAVANGVLLVEVPEIPRLCSAVDAVALAVAAVRSKGFAVVAESLAERDLRL